MNILYTMQAGKGAAIAVPGSAIAGNRMGIANQCGLHAGNGVVQASTHGKLAGKQSNNEDNDDKR